MKAIWTPIIKSWDINPFWGKVDKLGPDDCWLWSGNLSQGYGVAQVNGGSWKAHRIAYQITFGDIPKGMTIDHVFTRGCRIKSCCNPSHLEAVSQSVNTLRHYSRPDRLYPLACPAGHPKEFGRSQCRKCGVIWVAKSQAKNPDKYRKLDAEGQKRRRLARSISAQ